MPDRKHEVPKGEPNEFVPLTGNPENGNYADFIQHLENHGCKVEGGHMLHGAVFVPDKDSK